MANFLLGTLASVFAAFLVWLLWWLRMWFAAERYCGVKKAFDFEERTLVPMKSNPIATIRRGPRWWQPEILRLDGEHDQTTDPGNPGNRRKLTGRISINPIAFDRAVATLRYIDDPALAEYAIQDYVLLDNGDIYVVPAAAGDYKKHVLRRER